MKVILATKSIYPFHSVIGVQKYAYYLAKFLTKNNIDVEIVARLDKKGKPRREKIDGITYTLIRPAIYRYIEYPVGWIGVHLFSWSLAKYLQKKEFDVLHAFDIVSYKYLKFRDRRPTLMSGSPSRASTCRMETSLHWTASTRLHGLFERHVPREMRRRSG